MVKAIAYLLAFIIFCCLHSHSQAIQLQRQSCQNDGLQCLSGMICGKSGYCEPQTVPDPIVAIPNPKLEGEDCSDSLESWWCKPPLICSGGTCANGDDMILYDGYQPNPSELTFLGKGEHCSNVVQSLRCKPPLVCYVNTCTEPIDLLVPTSGPTFMQKGDVCSDSIKCAWPLICDRGTCIELPAESLKITPGDIQLKQEMQYCSNSIELWWCEPPLICLGLTCVEPSEEIIEDVPLAESSGVSLRQKGQDCSNFMSSWRCEPPLVCYIYTCTEPTDILLHSLTTQSYVPLGFKEDWNCSNIRCASPLICNRGICIPPLISKETKVYNLPLNKTERLNIAPILPKGQRCSNTEGILRCKPPLICFEICMEPRYAMMISEGTSLLARSLDTTFMQEMDVCSNFIVNKRCAWPLICFREICRNPKDVLTEDRYPPTGRPLNKQRMQKNQDCIIYFDNWQCEPPLVCFKGICSKPSNLMMQNQSAPDVKYLPKGETCTNSSLYEGCFAPMLCNKDGMCSFGDAPTSLNFDSSSSAAKVLLPNETSQVEATPNSTCANVDELKELMDSINERLNNLENRVLESSTSTQAEDAETTETSLTNFMQDINHRFNKLARRLIIKPKASVESTHSTTTIEISPILATENIASRLPIIESTTEQSMQNLAEQQSPLISATNERNALTEKLQFLLNLPTDRSLEQQLITEETSEMQETFYQTTEGIINELSTSMIEELPIKTPQLPREQTSTAEQQFSTVTTIEPIEQPIEESKSTTQGYTEQQISAGTGTESSVGNTPLPIEVQGLPFLYLATEETTESSSTAATAYDNAESPSYSKPRITTERILDKVGKILVEHEKVLSSIYEHLENLEERFPRCGDKQYATSMCCNCCENSFNLCFVAESTPSEESVTPTRESITLSGKSVTPTAELITPSGESVSTAAESITPSGESASTAAESITPSGESVSTAAESITPSGESVSTAAESITPSGESASTASESITPSGESASTAAESITPSGESASTASESITPSGESASTATESITPSGESASTASESITPSGESASTAAESITPSGESASTAAESITPSGESTSTAAESITPSGKSASTAAESITPSGESASTAAELITPSGESASTAAESITPSGESASTAAESITPSGESASTAAESITLSGESASTAAESITPSGESASTAAESITPSGESASTAAESITPSGESVSTAAESITPSGESTSTAAESITPSGETGSTAAESITPSGESASTAAESITPSGESASTAAESITPSGESASTAAESITPSGKSASTAAESITPSSESVTTPTSTENPSTITIAPIIVSQSLIANVNSNLNHNLDTLTADTQDTLNNAYDAAAALVASIKEKLALKKLKTTTTLATPAG